MWWKESKLVRLALMSVLLLLGNSNALEYKRGLTDHFISWLNGTGEYEPYGFNKTEFFGGSFGGKEDDDTPITKRPIIFIHGNGDMIIGDTDMNNGFRYSIEHFLEMGYTKAELYGSMWGWADVPHEPQHTLSPEYVMQTRRFIDAVLEYTQAPEVDVIAHSAGVLFSRRALKGGWAKGFQKRSYGTDLDYYYIGKPLGGIAKTFIAIDGPNWGAIWCTVPEIRAANRDCND